MKQLLLTFLFLAIGIAFLPLHAQQTQVIDVDVQVTYATHLGTTKPIRELVPMGVTDPDKKKNWKKMRQRPTNFIGRGKGSKPIPNALPQGPDPLWQKSFLRNPENRLEVLANIEGLSTGRAPHDPTGDVGNNYYVQAVNVTTLGVYNKQGELISSFAANTLWNSLGFSSAGDPIVMFDQEAQRWIITEFPPGNFLLVAVSKSDDPLGAYDAYSFGTPSFPDYPKYSIWGNSYSVTTNEQGPGQLETYFIDRTALLNGESEVAIQRILLPGVPGGPGFFVATPVDWTGATPPSGGPILMHLNDDAWGSSPTDQLEIYTVDLNFANSDNTTVSTQSLVTTPFDSRPCLLSSPGFACIPQLDGPTGIDGLPEIIMHQVHYRQFGTHESMVLNFITDVTGGENLSGIRWMELRRTQAGEDWTIYQEGTFAPDDGLHRFMGSIAMDGEGNIGLAYAVSSEDAYPGLRLTARKSGDPLGQMTTPEVVLIDGENPISNPFDPSRFGDYAHMTVDPVDDQTFWFTGEYGGGGNTDATTRIVSFRLSPDTIDMATTTVLSPVSGSELSVNEMVSVLYTNVGMDTITALQVGYFLEDSPAVVETINLSLPPDSSYLHTFSETTDLSVIGMYPLQTFCTAEGDGFIFNDTLRTVIQSIPKLDIGITNIDNGNGAFTCGNATTVEVTFTNFGTETVTSATISYSIDGVAAPPIEWTGSLAMGEETTVEVFLSGLTDGENEIVISLSSANGEIDQNPDNDVLERSFSVILGGATLLLDIQFDNFPTETTWNVTDESGDIVSFGGPYPEGAIEVSEEICLDPEACYTFNISDAFGDGICCGYGQGSYALTNDSGAVLASGGAFGSGESTDFCANFVCMLSADFSARPVSEPDGTDGILVLNALDGNGPISYSIDGGETFSNSNIFFDLEAGTYEVIVQDANCTFTLEVSIETCVLEVTATVTNETGPNLSDGTITIEAINGNPPYQFSINEGDTFSDEANFQNLPPGNYIVVVRDDLGCERVLEVMVDQVTSSSGQVFGQRIEVYPNPTTGLFQVELHGLQDKGAFSQVEVLDASGKIIQRSLLTRYDNTYTGMFSLVAYPNGVYYVRFLDESIKRVVKIIKQ
ncbi:MAG: T9SS type A sorting domain-containing protein [Bacteroidota bacterium]